MNPPADTGALDLQRHFAGAGLFDWPVYHRQLVFWVDFEGWVSEAVNLSTGMCFGVAVGDSVRVTIRDGSSNAIENGAGIAIAGSSVHSHLCDDSTIGGCLSGRMDGWAFSSFRNRLRWRESW